MSLTKTIISILIFFCSAMSFAGYCGVNDNKIFKLKRKGCHMYEDTAVELAINPRTSTCTLTFDKVQGMAEISICYADGKIADTFSASTADPIEWFMPEYEGYTVTITTDFAVYEAEL